MLTRYEHYTTGRNTGWRAFGFRWRGQSFTPLISHKIHSVKLWLSKLRGTPGNTIVVIRATDESGLPTGEDLCSGTIIGNTLPTAFDYEKREIVLNVDPPLAAGAKYAMLFNAPDDNNENCIVIWLDTSGKATYVGGAALESLDYGRSWRENPLNDFLFEEWGEEIILPTFAPGELKTAVASITVKPAGLACEAEVFLAPDEVTKVATSGRRPFVSTGYSQETRLPIVMPDAEGIYHVYADIYAEDYLIAVYQAIDDVVIAR